MKKFMKRFDWQTILVICLCLVLIFSYFVFKIIKLDIDGTPLLGNLVHYYLSPFELFNGTNDIDKEYISNIVSLGLLILPICSILVSIFIKKKVKKIINACIFLLVLGVFIYSFFYFRSLYVGGIEISSLLSLKTKIVLQIQGYIYIFIIVLGGAFSAIDFFKSK